MNVQNQTLVMDFQLLATSSHISSSIYAQIVKFSFAILLLMACSIYSLVYRFDVPSIHQQNHRQQNHRQQNHRQQNHRQQNGKQVRKMEKKIKKLTDFMLGILRSHKKFTHNKDAIPIFRTDDELGDMMYNRIRNSRRLYLYMNRFLQENELAPEEKGNFKKLLNVMLKKSDEFIYEIPIITIPYKFSNKQKRYFEITVKNIRKFKYIYYNRKTVVAILINNKLPPPDLCRKIADYLY